MLRIDAMGNCIRKCMIKLDTLCCVPSRVVSSFSSDTFSKASASFRPLDLVAFKGTGLLSTAVSISQDVVLGKGGGAWTHVGILVNSDLMPKLKNAKPGHWYVWESTSLADTADIESMSMKLGVQIRNLEDVCKAYGMVNGTRCSVFKLTHNPWVAAGDNAVAREAIRALIERMHISLSGRPFDFTGGVPALCPCIRKVRDENIVLASLHDYAMYNAELVAQVYCALGITANNINTANVVPGDFFGRDRDNEIALDIVDVSQPIVCL